MKLAALRYLVAFADEGSFSRAADRCQVSQPTLSVALKNLEDELGASLIERAKGFVRLTALGRRIAAHARLALEQTLAIERIVRMDGDPLQGRFRLGVIHTIGPYLLPELVSAMRAIAPDMHLFIEESMTALLVEMLRSATVDAALVALPFDVPGVRIVPLYDEPFEVIVPREHAWAKRQRIRTDELPGEDVLVLKAGNCFRDQVIDACPELSHADGSLQEGHSIETVRSMVASGYGISVLPAASLIGIYRNPLVVSIPFEPPAPSRRVALAWRECCARPEAIDAICRAVRSIDNGAFHHLPAGAVPPAHRAEGALQSE